VKPLPSTVTTPWATAPTSAQQAQTLATEKGAAAQNNRTTAANWQRYADDYSAKANTYRSRITDSPRNFWQRLLNRVYRGLAEFSERVASNLQNRANNATNAANIAQAEADQARTTANNAIAQKAAAEATATHEENRATALQQQASDTQQAAADKQADAENYLSQSTEPTNNLKEHRFVYGPNNRLIGEYQGNGALKQDIIRLGTLPVATVDASGAIHYIHTDHLGTPRAATMPNGDVVWNWISSPFGDTKANEDVDGDGNTFTLNLRFPGQYFDEETELHYNYFRDYDPGTGRYVQSDPIGLNGGLNTYAYVGGNPLSYTDSYGLAAWGLNFGGGVAFRGKNYSLAVAFVADSNGTSGILVTPEFGGATKGGGVFARALYASGDNTFDTLIGPGASVSGSVSIFSGSVSVPYLNQQRCNENGTFETYGGNDPVYEFGFGRGSSQVSATVGNSYDFGRNNFLGDISKAIGDSIYDITH
jgi:RHS repeat-associated protein